MATLRYSQIRAHPGGTIRYIANKNKIISEKVHDVRNVLNYMGEPESTERVYSFGHHCSTNPSLAEKQMELYRARYFASKRGGVQGLAGLNELLGLHFFLSYSEGDNPSEKVMNEILRAVAAHPKFRDFPIFGANHFDKTHKHTHFYISQYSAVGKPRKLCMRHEDYNDLRRFVNRLCVERGLSVIDLPALRTDPEYSDWLDGVIAEGKVIVHPEREEHKRATRQKAKTKNLYYKWLKEQEEFNAEEEKRLTKAQLTKKKIDNTIFYSVDGKSRHPVSAENGKRYYCIRRYTETGRERSTLELLVLLIYIIAENEKKYIQSQNALVHRVFNATVDYKAQAMVDSVRVAREMNITSPAEIPRCIADIGKQMNALKREKARHENSVKKHEAIIAAWETYERVRPFVEGVREPENRVLSEYKNAYAVLAANQVLTAEAFAELHSRYLFESRKVSDYEERLPELKKQYRALKSLEVSTRPTELVDEIYRYSAEASKGEKLSPDDIIKLVEGVSKPQKKERAREDDLLYK